MWHTSVTYASDGQHVATSTETSHLRMVETCSGRVALDVDLCEYLGASPNEQRIVNMVVAYGEYMGTGRFL